MKLCGDQNASLSKSYNSFLRSWGVFFIHRYLLKKDIYLISNLDVVGVKGLDSFINNIKKAKKEKGDIFIMRSYQIIILYVKLNIKMQYLSLF